RGRNAGRARAVRQSPEQHREERGGEQVRDEHVDEEGRGTRDSPAEALLRGLDRGDGGQGRREGADGDGGKKRAAPPFEDGAEEKTLDAGVQIAELPQAGARLLETGASRHERRSRTTRARSARTSARRPSG